MTNAQAFGSGPLWRSKMNKFTDPKRTEQRAQAGQDADNSHKTVYELPARVVKKSPNRTNAVSAAKIAVRLSELKNAGTTEMTRSEVRELMSQIDPQATPSNEAIDNWLVGTDIALKVTRAPRGTSNPKDSWHMGAVLARQLLEVLDALGMEGTQRIAINNILKSN